MFPLETFLQIKHMNVIVYRQITLVENYNAMMEKG